MVSAIYRVPIKRGRYLRKSMNAHIHNSKLSLLKHTTYSIIMPIKTTT